MDSGVTDRPDMRDQLLAHVIGDGRGTRRSCPGYLVTCWRGVNHHVAGRPGGQRHDRPYPGGLSWSTRIPVQRPAIPRARRHRSGQPPGAGQHDRPVHHLAQRHGCGGRLRRIAERAVACCGAGLRRERVHARRPEGPALGGQRRPLPARALSAQVQLARPVDPVCRAGRGSAPITGLIHLRPPSGPPPGPGARPAVPYGLLVDCSRRSVCCPGPAASQPSGATARSGAGSRGAGRGRRASADGRRPCGAPGGDGGHVMALFPAWHAGARFARPGNPAAAGSLAGRQVPARAACVLTDKG